MTRYARQVADTTLVVQCNAALARQAEWLLDTVSGFKDRGKGLVDGATVQVGWSILTLEQRGAELVVCEPDFAGDPLTGRVDDVSTTLTVLMHQRDLLARLKVAGTPALFNDKIILSRGALDESHIYLERSDPRPGDSGWYLGPVAGDAPDEDADPNEVYESRYVYQLLRQRPRLIEVLALPPGYLVVFTGDEIEAVLNEDGVNIWSTESPN